MLDGYTEQCRRRWSSWYFTVSVAHRKTKSSTFCIVMKMTWFHGIFTPLTCCMSHSARCHWCSGNASSVKGNSGILYRHVFMLRTLLVRGHSACGVNPHISFIALFSYANSANPSYLFIYFLSPCVVLHFQCSGICLIIWGFWRPVQPAGCLNVLIRLWKWRNCCRSLPGGLSSGVQHHRFCPIMSRAPVYFTALGSMVCSQHKYIWSLDNTLFVAEGLLLHLLDMLSFV